jgi:hypothetical protein
MRTIFRESLLDKLRKIKGQTDAVESDLRIKVSNYARKLKMQGVKKPNLFN